MRDVNERKDNYDEHEENDRHADGSHDDVCTGRLRRQGRRNKEAGF